MFINNAWAQGSGGGADLFTSFVPLILIVVVFYFLLIRPQQKKQKAHQQKINEVKRGDYILTAGGIYANVVKVNDDNCEAEIAPNVVVKVAKAMIADTFSKDSNQKSAKTDKEQVKKVSTGSKAAKKTSSKKSASKKSVSSKKAPAKK